MDVVVVIRHPAAFIHSMLRLNWTFDPSEQFGTQPLLMRDLLDSWREAILNPPQDPIVNLATVWLVIYRVLHMYVERNPDWILVKHERLSLQPVPAFKSLFSQLSIAYDDQVEAGIIDHTAPSNPVDAPGNVAEHLKRDSAANVKRWKSFLSADQVSKIRNVVEPLSHLYYCEDEW